ncbi:MAG: hypothetical protein H6Q69_3506 [Firmicutes bacterium]|nr:hypothetical protein [Bacillota bacterium]
MVNADTKYKIDRLKLITYKGQKKKVLFDLRCRYLAKSQLVKCNAQHKKIEFANFRGSRFKKVNFDNTQIIGNDFWGTTFRDCSFKNAVISDCVFMSCILKNCDFTGAKFNYTTIVNTNLADCKNMDIAHDVNVLKEYPKNKISAELAFALDKLKDNKNIRKNKLLHLPNNRYNELNLFLLLKKIGQSKLASLLLALNEKSTKNVTTYKKLELELKKIIKEGYNSSVPPHAIERLRS